MCRFTTLGALFNVAGKRCVSKYFVDPAGEIPPLLMKPENLIWYKLEKLGEFIQAVRRMPGKPESGMKMESLVRGQTPEVSCCEPRPELCLGGFFAAGNSPQVCGKIVIGLLAGAPHCYSSARP
jgi:hypothetical protein